MANILATFDILPPIDPVTGEEYLPKFELMGGMTGSVLLHPGICSSLTPIFQYRKAIPRPLCSSKREVHDAHLIDGFTRSSTCKRENVSQLSEKLFKSCIDCLKLG